MGVDERIIVRLVVAFDVGRLTPNKMRGKHWGAIQILTRRAQMAARCVYLQAGSPTWEGPVTVALTVRRGRRLDPDGALGGSKQIIDSLFRRRDLGYGLTWDDSAAWLEFAPVRQETGKQWKGKEEVEIVVTPREETP